MKSIIHVLYCIYQLVIAAPLAILATILTSLFTVVGAAIGSTDFWGYWPSHLWARFILAILFIPVKVKGRENVDKDTSYVFLANHQGSFDIFLIYGYLNRDFKWMMKMGIKKMPFVGAACVAAHHIFVDNSSPKKTAETIDLARKTLQKGTSMAVFPEGRRSFNGKMGPFKKGAFILADELQLPVVPMTIDGAFDILPRTKGLNFIKWHRLVLTMHQPIPPTGQGTEDIKVTMQKTREAINTALPKKYQD